MRATSTELIHDLLHNDRLARAPNAGNNLDEVRIVESSNLTNVSISSNHKSIILNNLQKVKQIVQCSEQFAGNWTNCSVRLFVVAEAVEVMAGDFDIFKIVRAIGAEDGLLVAFTKKKHYITRPC